MGDATYVLKIACNSLCHKLFNIIFWMGLYYNTTNTIIQAKKPNWYGSLTIILKAPETMKIHEIYEF